MNALELADIVKQSHPDHARLLSSKRGNLYLALLGQQKFRQQVAQAFGEDIARSIANSETINDSTPAYSRRISIASGEPVAINTIETAIEQYETLIRAQNEARFAAHDDIQDRPDKSRIFEALCKQHVDYHKRDVDRNKYIKTYEAQVKKKLSQIKTHSYYLRYDTTIEELASHELAIAIRESDIPTRVRVLNNAEIIEHDAWEFARELKDLYHKETPKYTYTDIPRIRYNDQTKQVFDESIRTIENTLQTIADISDLAIPSKLYKEEFSYQFRVMQRNPLDITFGNDSGCCIAIPKGPHTDNKFESIPYYLCDPKTHLIELIQIGKKERRVGFLPVHELQRSVLAANSLELSKLMIPGGKEAKMQLANLAEEFLIEYADVLNLTKVTMGNFYRNKAILSSRTKEPVKRVFTIGYETPFESNILDKNGRTISEKNYWIRRR